MIEMNFEAHFKSNSVDHKLAEVDEEKIIPVKAALKIEQARATKKGKLIYISNALSHKSKLQDSLRNLHQVSESGNMYNNNIFCTVF